MGKTMSTQGICDELQVSRDWVNKHLRVLGGAVPDIRRDKANVRTIFYYREDVLCWLNQNAHYSRQTQLVDLSDYAEQEEIEAMYADIDSIPESIAEGRRLRREIYQDFLRSHLPSKMSSAAELVNPRARGQLPWVPMQYHISSLNQLRSMKDLMEEWGHRSQEMTYRTIYQKGMIRVAVAGRMWFMEPPEASLQYPLILPATMD